MPSRPLPAGFTLLELLIVLSLMGIIAAAVLPSANPSVHGQLHAAAEVIASDLAWARSLAVTNNSTYRLRLVPNQNRYIIEHTGSRSALDVLPTTPHASPDDPPTQRIVWLDELPQLQMAVDLLGGQKRTVPAAPTSEVEFTPLGATTETNDTVIWIAAGAGSERRYISVRVQPITGLTWIENYRATAPGLGAGEANQVNGGG